MQAYLLSGLRSPTSSVNLFHPLPKPRVSNHYQSSSLHYHYHNNNNQSKLTLHHRPRPTPGWGGRNGVIFAAAATATETNCDHDEQDHYAVLGISPTASLTEIRRAYRDLAKKYHPDVCKDSKSNEMFKSIQHAYDVLSNEVTRAQYDFRRKFQAGPRWKSKNYWQQSETYESSDKSEYWQQSETYESLDKSDTSEENERGSFIDVLISALFARFFMQNNVSQLHIFCFSLSAVYLFSRCLLALYDKKLNGGSQLGYLIAWFLGGTKGSLLTLCLSFESWAFGKRAGSLVTLIVVAMWVVTNLVKLWINLVRVGINIVIYPARAAINLARYASSSIPQAALTTRVGIDLARYALTSIPRGALIALLYMSIKLQTDSSKA